MFVTVHEHKPKQEIVNGEFGAQTLVETENISHKGDVMKIAAVQLPYVVVVHYSPYAQNPESCRGTIDTRKTTLMELENDYITALIPKLAPLLPTETTI
jgi:hypothetical protein